jgi:eukaryotic-like serine/threonine-protein kinase
MLGKSEPLTEEERSFLQRRVAAFGLVGGVCYGFFLLFRSVLALATGQHREFSDSSFWYHLLATACFVGLWAVCRVARLQERTIRTAETLGLLGGVVASVLMAASIDAASRPDLIVVLALTFVMMSRAVWVPSSARRSLFLGVAVGVELVIAMYSVFHDERAVAVWKALEPGVQGATPDRLSRIIAANVAAWWTLTVFLTTMASYVIYGLRRDVRNAKRLGQYTLEKKLGEGGMGVVYRARHAMLQRPTAVKLLLPDRAGAGNLKRFEAEVRQTARLNHPNIVTIFDYGHTAEGVFYYAMEYIDGATLEQAVEHSGAMPSARVAHVLRAITAALVQAHGVGLIHRDIKPANVILFLPHAFGGVEEGVKLLDFGLVKEVNDAGAIQLTNADAISGTPQYMAPEAIREPKSVDGRSDLYAVGAVGYYLLTGRHVFEARSVVEVCSHHLHTPPVPPSQRAGLPIPAELERLVLECLEKDPKKRPQSARELERRLEAFARAVPWTPEAAHAWWTEHRAPSLGSERPAHEVSPLALTIDVRRGGELSS